MKPKEFTGGGGAVQADLEKDAEKGLDKAQAKLLERDESLIETSNLNEAMSRRDKVVKGKWHRMEFMSNTSQDCLGTIPFINFLNDKVVYVQYDTEYWLPDYIKESEANNKRLETSMDRSFRKRNGQPAIDARVASILVHPFTVYETVTRMPRGVVLGEPIPNREAAVR